VYSDKFLPGSGYPPSKWYTSDSISIFHINSRDLERINFEFKVGSCIGLRFTGLLGSIHIAPMVQTTLKLRSYSSLLSPHGFNFNVNIDLNTAALGTFTAQKLKAHA
jgi:hypothetical protein